MDEPEADLSRVDRLRALGNICMPQVAALAFLDLLAELASEVEEAGS